MMVCSRRTKTLVSTCVILSGMTNIVCLLYVGWITNYVANVNTKVPEPEPERKFEDDNKGETLKIIERLDRLENVVNQHIQEVPQKDSEEKAGKSLSDSSLFVRWGHDLGPESRRVALKKFQYYGYNGFLSDRLSLTRPIPDLRPDGCRNMSYPTNLPQVSIIFIFVNEALSVILRSIHTAMNRTPAHLLKEIILVDDNSNNAELKENLQHFVKETNSQRPDFIKLVRHDKQEGLIRSRVSGWRAASAPVVALFDAHVEFNIGWAEPILLRIKEDRTRIISPSFDNIKYDTFEIEEYPLSAQGFDWELWCRYLNPPKAWWTQHNHTAPIRSPALIGCFVVDRKYFEKIGLLDEGMEVYGGENVELGIRVWQCGGSVEVLPCSRIAHIERAHKPYTQDLTAHVRRNALRVAEVWMDEYKNHVYMAWNIPPQNSGIDIGDLTERKALRNRLQCKSFSWFLANIYSEMRTYSDTVAYGVLKNTLRSDLCLDQGPDSDNIPILYICHGMTPQNVYYTNTQQLHLGVLSPTIDDDDNKCLVDVNSRPRLLECSYATAKRMKLAWQFTQVRNLQRISLFTFKMKDKDETQQQQPQHGGNSAVRDYTQSQYIQSLLDLG
ncbi:polypeptide N-acetylgalactosaminyltransferase 18 isoform X2 [Coregonus clupeaformis]|uniref:polypeptide N-acetylgalactosaminyltransferase 18 isoform X2 n=1 Tax=Coregonus clupeaformis TaxID=59861 RepID=UPI001BE0DBD5|nr:polypeptide N-acetylgalactosaminyltransferase 18 isoform X2 [Coregonus clupeaformis]